ncbi:hypothetical protein E2C01_047547 [Portunus trituberculatus]|uniref:Uncharacterized protein n=1 Tax=Portunus trituberculatus TaxID=210409 RepID=A0A5B7G7S2_PORTR|nr:hypothetical protein [Portunus trituberculatus]
MTNEHQEKPSNTNIPNTVPDRRECVSISAEGYLETESRSHSRNEKREEGGGLSAQQNSLRGQRWVAIGYAYNEIII